MQRIPILLVLRLCMFLAVILSITGVLRLISPLVHFADLMTICRQEQQTVIKSAKCTNADIRLRTPDDGQKGCPKHAESSYQ